MSNRTVIYFGFFFSSRRRHTRCLSDWSSDVCSSDLLKLAPANAEAHGFLAWLLATCPDAKLWAPVRAVELARKAVTDRKSTRLNSSHLGISYAVFCLKKKKKK